MPKSIASSAKIISALILLSRVLGLVRDMLAASLFGTSWIYDAFVIAFIIPNLFRRIFGEGALTAAFVPAFTDYLENKPRQEALKFVGNILTVLTALLSAITLLGIIFFVFAPDILSSFFDIAPKTQLTSHLTAIMLPYMPLVCVVAILSAALNCVKHFAAPAIASVLLNISWIAGLLAAKYFSSNPTQQVTWMAWSIVIGGALELILQLPVFVKKELNSPAVFDLHHPGLRETAGLMFPVVFGLSVMQINYLADNLIAEICVPGDGAVSALYYGNRLMQLPLALFGIALAQAAFPFFSEYIARKDYAKAQQSMIETINSCLYIAVPASIGMAVLALPLTRLLFERGSFNELSSSRTSIVLLMYSFGIWSMACQQIITRAFYAMKDMKTPLKIGIAMVGLNFALNLTLVWFLREAGLALATTICSLLNMSILLRLLKKNLPGLEFTQIHKMFLKAFFASCLMGLACKGILLTSDKYGHDILHGKTAFLLAQNISAVLVGAAVYFTVMKLMRGRKLPVS